MGERIKRFCAVELLKIGTIVTSEDVTVEVTRQLTIDEIRQQNPGWYTHEVQLLRPGETLYWYEGVIRPRPRP